MPGLRTIGMDRRVTVAFMVLPDQVLIEGIFYGQCSFICGQNHAFMPIAIRVVSQERYTAWLAEAKQKFANAADATSKVAEATR